MKTKLQLMQERADAVAAAKKISTDAETAKVEMTPEQSKQMDALLDNAEKLTADIADFEKVEARGNRLSALETTLGESAGRQTAPDASVPLLVDADGGAIKVDKPNILKDKRWGFESRGQFVKAIMDYSRKQPIIDARLQKIMDLSAVALGGTTAVGEDGGFLVAPQFANEIFTRVFERLPILEQTRRYVLSNTNSITIPALKDADRSNPATRYGGLFCYWVDEATAPTRSSLKFRNINLKLNKMMALAYVTSEILRFTVNYDALLMQDLEVAISEETTEAFMFGSGVNQPKGALASNAALTLARATTKTVGFGDITTMLAQIWSPRADGKFYFNQELIPQLCQLSFNPGGLGVIPVFLPLSQGLTDPVKYSLYGHQAIPTEHCSALGTAGDIIYASYDDYYVALAGSIETAMSIHLRFDYDELCFRAVWFADGRPAWDAPITPRKGTAKQSPWIQLETK